MGYDRRVKEEIRLQAEVTALFQQAEAADVHDDAMMLRMDRLSVAINGRLSWPAGSSGLRQSGPPRLSWSTRRTRRPR
jgi:uncharacterized protein YhdP